MNARFALFLALTLASPLPAQPGSQVVVTGEGEVRLAPTAASIVVSIGTRGATAGEAASRNAAVARAVRRALEASGVPADSIRTAGYAVHPYVERDGDQDRTEGHVALNNLQVATGRLDRLGALVDVALGAGATGIAAINYTASGIPEARRLALREAVADARADAEAVASAGGGRLGEILEMTTSPSGSGLFGSSQRIVIRGASATQLTPEEIRVSATVQVRFALQQASSR